MNDFTAAARPETSNKVSSFEPLGKRVLKLEFSTFYGLSMFRDKIHGIKLLQGDNQNTAYIDLSREGIVSVIEAGTFNKLCDFIDKNPMAILRIEHKLPTTNNSNRKWDLIAKEVNGSKTSRFNGSMYADFKDHIWKMGLFPIGYTPESKKFEDASQTVIPIAAVA